MIPPSKSKGASAVIQKASCSKPLGSNATDACLSNSPFSHRSSNGIGDAIGQHRFAVDLLGRFLRVQRQERTFRVHHAVADFHFLLLVHERFADVGVVSVRLAVPRTSADQ